MRKDPRRRNIAGSKRRRIGEMLGASSLALVALVAFSLPAGAGQWTEPYTWGSGDVVGDNYVHQGNIVAVWQSMMSLTYGGWCKPFQGCTNQIDGKWGPITKNYTIWWQAQMHSIAPGVTQTGNVDAASWNASRWFFLGPGTPDRSGNGNVYYWWNPNGGTNILPIMDSTGYATWLVTNCYGLYPYVIIGDPHIDTLWNSICNGQ
jgi:hypothetical protein